MYEFVIVTGLIGGLLSLMLSGVLAYEMAQRGFSPRKIILCMLGFILGGVIVGILLPLIALAGMIHIIVSFVKNDWGWYKPHLPKRSNDATNR